MREREVLQLLAEGKSNKEAGGGSHLASTPFGNAPEHMSSEAQPAQRRELTSVCDSAKECQLMAPELALYIGAACLSRWQPSQLARRQHNKNQPRNSGNSTPSNKTSAT